MKRWIVCALSLLTVATVVTASSSSSSKDRQKALDKAHYVAYQGQQQAWPTGDRSAVKTVVPKSGVTIYRSLPPKPYEILGLIQVARDDSTARRAADAALAAGADAILVCTDAAFVRAGISPQPSVTSTGENASDITALTGLLIRWKLSAP